MRCECRSGRPSGTDPDCPTHGLSSVAEERRKVFEEQDAVVVRNASVEEAWRKYVDGAITYVEFVRKVASLVFRQDCVDHNDSISQLPEYVAKWPFEG